MSKQAPCCARLTSKLRLAKADVVGLARKAARGNPSASLVAKIAEAKASVAESERHIIEHEGEHADAA